MRRGRAPLFIVLLVAIQSGIAGAAGAALIRQSVHFDVSEISVIVEPAGTRFRLRDGSTWNQPGEPRVPFRTVFIRVPGGETVTSVRVVAAEGMDLGSFPEPARGVSRRGPSGDAWDGRSLFPPRAGQAGPISWLRGTALQGVVLWPLEWDPAAGRARLHTRIDIEVETEPAPAPEGVWRPLRRDTPAGARFDGLIRSLVLNPEAPASRPVEGATRPLDSGATPFSPRFRPSVDGSPVDYVIITSDALAPLFEDLAAWKTESGILTVVRTVEWIRTNYPGGVDLQETIRRFIADAASRWGTRWVLLAGDTDIIPVRIGTTLYFGGEMIPADMYYQCLDGSWNGDGDAIFGEAYLNATMTGDSVDLLPEVWLGRAAVSDSAGAATFVTKTIGYEKTPPPGFLDRAMIMAEVLFPQHYTVGDSIIFDGAVIAEDALSYFPPAITPTRLYENAPAYSGVGAMLEDKPTVISHVNMGYGFIQHIGHGYVNTMAVGAGGLALDNADVAAFWNGPKTCILYSINCTSAAIDFNCIGEEWIENPNGGAVANIGSTRYDFPGTGIDYQNEFYRVLFQTDDPTLGEAFALSKVTFAPLSWQDSEHRWTQFSQILLGDPALRVWRGEPGTLAAAHPASLPLGALNFPVTVTRDGLPVPGALVCLHKEGDDYETSLTDGSGQAVLAFRPDRPGTARITVTAGGGRPYQASIPVSQPAAPHLYASATQIDDLNPPAAGNGDGILDLQETGGLNLVLSNRGTAQATSVSASLSTTDPNLLILDAGATYPDLNPGADQPPLDGFLVRVVGPATDRYETSASLTITANGYVRSESVVILAGAPAMERFLLTVSDEGVGNGNGVIEAGENQLLTMTVRNNGRGTVQGLVGKLRSLDGQTTITDSTSNYGHVPPDSTDSGDAFMFQFSDGLTTHLMRFVLESPGGVLMSFDVDVQKPAAPTNLAGGGKTTSISLTWNLVAATDLKGYVVYRSSAAGGPFTRVNAFADSKISYYSDENLPPLTRFYYRVAAVDLSGNEGPMSTTAAATTTLPPSQGFPIPLGGATSSAPTFSYFNGDTIPEIVTGSQEIYVVSGTGEEYIDGDNDARTHGIFTQSGFANFWSPPSSTDIDRDGVIDVAAAGWSNGNLYLYDGRSTPKPGFPVNVNVNQLLSPATWSAPVMVDVDGDQVMEIFINSGAHTYAYRADGTELVDGDNNPATTGVFAVLGVPSNYSTPVVTDLNNDQVPEVIITSRDTKLYVKNLNGTNFPGFPITYPGDITSTPAIGDLDLDGLPEMVFGSSDNKLRAVNINGASPPGWPLGVNFNQDLDASPALADVDGDGYLDVAACSGNGTVYIFHGQNGSLFTGFPVVILDSSGVKIQIRSSPAIGSVDSDPDLEVVFGGRDGNVHAYKKNGQPVLGFPIKTDNVVEGGPLVWDLDGDGLTEVCVHGFDQKLYMWDTPAAFSPESCPWPMFAHDSRRTSVYGNPIFIVTGTPEEAPPAPPIHLLQNRPNPFGRSTAIHFSLSGPGESQPVRLSIFDVRGRLVRRLVDGELPGGEHAITWDGSDDRGTDVGSGVYFYRLETSGNEKTRRMILSR